MKNHFSRIIKYLSLALSITMIFSPLTSLSVRAAKTEPKVVRVGWFHSDMFQEGMSDDQEKSGYCYDYLQKVADYTKWKYEYVYGDWTELIHMLINGQIDFLAGVSWTEERQEQMLFPDMGMGNDQYYLFKHDDDNTISTSDISTLKGKKVGGIIDNRTTTFTEQWNEENNAGLEIVYFESFEEQEAAFARGELDLLGQTIYNILSLDGISVVAKVGEEPFYLAINKNRPDLKQDLDQALAIMTSTDPFILQDMQYENYGSSLVSRTLSDQEQEWLNNHPQIKVGYLDKYLPYSSTDKDGNATGLVTDVLNEIVSELSLSDSVSVQYQGYSNYQDMISSLKKGEINIAFPVYGNLWQLEQDGIDASSAVLTATETLFYSGKYSQDSIKTISVNKNNSMQIAYTKKYFPDAQLLECDNIEKCLDMIVSRKADATIINTMRTALVTCNSKYSKLSYYQLPTEEKRCFGVDSGERDLLLILNRGLNVIGSSYSVDTSNKYVGELYKYTAMDFIRTNILKISVLVLIFVGIVVWLLLRNIQKKEKTNLELEKLRNSAVKAGNAKTAFLFSMSHEIRTPINAIIGYSELMQRQFDDKEACRDYLEKLRRSSNFLLSIINNVLEMARIESGKVELNEEKRGALSVLDEVSSVYEGLMEQKGLTFICEADIKSDYLYLDKVKLNEIFLNLLSNAYKYTPEGGSVSVSLRELPSDREGYTIFETTVSDTGIGMSKEYLATVFEPFSREKSVAQSNISGTGLGMAIVKNLVDLMGGTIVADSEPGKGTTYVVTIPHRIASETDENAVGNDNAENIQFEGKRILLAEDNELNAEIATVILKDAGFEVELAEDGAICVDMLKSRDGGYYDLILMDVQMPNMDGYEATRTIRRMEDPLRSQIPIIAMTANAFETDKENALNAGMNAHISKPIHIATLMETLKSVMK